MVNSGGSAAVLRRGRVTLLCTLLVFGGAVLLRHDVSSVPAPGPRQGTLSTNSLLARVPLSFEPNLGQSSEAVKFVARGRGYGLYLTSTEAVLNVASATPSHSGAASIQMHFAGAVATDPKGNELLHGHTNYFIGNDSSRWLHNVPQYARVRYDDLYPGVDLDFYGREGRLEYDFTVAPGADPRKIDLQFEGADALRIADDGSLVLKAAGRELRFESPRIFQKTGDQENAVEGKFVLSADGHAGFQVGEYDRTRALVIDPVLTFSTYVGGSGNESCAAILNPVNGFIPHCPAVALDSAARVYIAGVTDSTSGWPTPFSGPTSIAPGGGPDVFVARISNNGTAVSLDFLTFLGGTGTDYPVGVGVDSAANLYVAGNTNSSDFPTAGGFQASATGNHAFLTKLDSSGSANLYSTYVAGSGTESASDLALDNQGHAYLIGTTTSNDFPVTPGALQGTYPSGVINQFFFAKFDSAQSGSNSLLYATYFGGASSGGSMFGGAVAVDSNLDVYLAGGTNFSDIPVVNAFQATPQGGVDVWAARLKAPRANTQQYSLVYQTYLGGPGNDVAYGVATDGTNTFLTGSTTSSTGITIPTGTTPFQSAFGGGSTLGDAFLAKFSVPPTTGTTQGAVPLNYFSYLGGTGEEVGLAITVDSSQTVRLTGLTTAGSAIPHVSPITGVPGGGTDAFFARIATSSGTTSAVNILGGSGTDIGTSIATDALLDSFIAGENRGGGLPTSGQLTAFQPSPSGPSDAFVIELGSSVAGLAMDCPAGSTVNGLTISGCTPSAATANPTPAGVGNKVTFTFPIYNTTDPINGGVFTATLPAGNGTITAARPSTGTCNFTATSATCNLGVLNPSTTTTSGSTTTLGTSATVAIDVTAPVPNPPVTQSFPIGLSGVLTLSGVNFRATPQNQPPATINDFNVKATPNSQTITAGNQATYTITVTPTGIFPESVSLGSCSGLPASAACSVSSSSIPNLNNGPQSRTLNITTQPRITTPASLFHPGNAVYAFWFPLSGLAFIGAGMTRKRRWLAGFFIAGTLALMLSQAACSSYSSNTKTTTGTPAGTYTITVNATSGSATRSTAVTLTVQ